MPFYQFLFRPKNELEKGGRTPPLQTAEDSELAKQCPACGSRIPLSTIWERANTCTCGYHFRMNARQRIQFITDPGTFQERDVQLTADDALSFPGYQKKLATNRVSCREQEGVICGTASIAGQPCALFVMEPYFMMGSMGMAVGEKITRLFEYATEARLPVVGFTASGGARMQEGLLALMQMAKTSGAIRRFSDGGGFYLTVLTDPTTGGVTASFAMEGDLILAEPGATVGFAGARVVEQTTKKKLPEGFQKAEFMLQHGFIDGIVSRKNQRDVIGKLLGLHIRGDQP